MPLPFFETSFILPHIGHKTKIKKNLKKMPKDLTKGVIRVIEW